MWNPRAISATLCLSLAFGHVTPAWAAPEDLSIPQKPSAPPPLTVKGPADGFRCQRYFSHQGKVLTCDSYTRIDAENLRPVIQNVPAAVSELNLYQRNRFRVRNAAYTGSLGLLVILGGWILSNGHRGASGNLNATGRSILNFSLIGGAAITGGSFLYAISFIKTNETHLGNAVTLYNQAHPESPIELHFTTGISF
ncbi:MAG: hypothetical protein NDJ90_02780 [Oligoflexia bacterium]|nr:hypothetical protein [Oligoflexia bacterium]